MNRTWTSAAPASAVIDSKRCRTLVAWFLFAWAAGPGWMQSATAETAADARAVEELYERFVSAQNAKDVATVRSLLSPSPQFQWVSDGKVFWGREAMLERMVTFQKSEVWRVEPDRAARQYIPLSPQSGYLFQPLTLVIGTAQAPDRLAFLVNVVCSKSERGWEIIALFTTLRKPA